MGIFEASDDQGLISRNFAACKFVKLPGTPGNMLNRADFIDILIRIARSKYYDPVPEPKSVELVAKGLQKMLDKIMNTFKFYPWQEFRDQFLWKNEVDKVYKLNLNKLKILYTKLFPKFEMIGLQQCINLMAYESGLQMSDKEAKFCYGMSKMTVSDEVGMTERYRSLNFVEFIEFVGRVAFVKYKDEDGTPLEKKIERVLDEIFPVYGLRRTKDKGQIDDDNTSEESVEVDEDEIKLRAELMGKDELFLYQ